MASSFARKNPLASIEAFRKAFGDDPSTRLIVKISNSETFPSGLSSLMKAIGSAPNIVLIDRTISGTEMEALYRESDLLISLHRSEGFGLTIAEAMLRGLPVVATNWSGNIDFLNTSNGFPIPYLLVSAEDLQGTYHHPYMKWADADVEAAAEALRHLRRDPALARDMGQAGVASAAQTWSGEAYATTVCRYLGL
jgi:glycosyltransferase involved in cell wall biosynthesis